MNTRVTPKREKIKLCELEPGNTFICPIFDEDRVLMVVNPNPDDGDITLDFEDGMIIGIDLNDGELWSFEPDISVYKVNGEFSGSY